MTIAFRPSVGSMTAAFSSWVRKRQFRLVDFNPANTAAPLSMGRRFAGRLLVERACGNDGSLVIARSMRHRTIAGAANLPRKAFCFRQIEPPDQLFTMCPAKLIDRHDDIGRAHAAGSLAAAGTVAMSESHKRRAHLITDRLAKTAPSKHLFG